MRNMFIHAALLQQLLAASSAAQGSDSALSVKLDITSSPDVNALLLADDALTVEIVAFDSGHTERLLKRLFKEGESLPQTHVLYVEPPTFGWRELKTVQFDVSALDVPYHPPHTLRYMKPEKLPPSKMSATVKRRHKGDYRKSGGRWC